MPATPPRAPAAHWRAAASVTTSVIAPINTARPPVAPWRRAALFGLLALCLLPGFARAWQLQDLSPAAAYQQAPLAVVARAVAEQTVAEGKHPPIGGLAPDTRLRLQVLRTLKGTPPGTTLEVTLNDIVVAAGARPLAGQARVYLLAPPARPGADYRAAGNFLCVWPAEAAHQLPDCTGAPCPARP